MKRIAFVFRPVLIIYALLALVTVAAYFADDAARLVSTVSAASDNRLCYVVDPGHGGEDGGACTDDGTREADLNLSIGRRLALVLRFFGREVVLTRESDTIEYPRGADTTRQRKQADLQMRVDAANALPNAFFISIHQNKFSDPRPFGAQVLFNDLAADFAPLLQDKLVSSLMPENYRTAVRASDELYVMKHVRCPAVLVECGFLSNPEELALLRTDGYQLRIAAAIAVCSVNCEELLIIQESGGTNENQNRVLLY